MTEASYETRHVSNNDRQLSMQRAAAIKNFIKAYESSMQNIGKP
jgi:hypothetical protein